MVKKNFMKLNYLISQVFWPGLFLICWPTVEKRPKIIFFLVNIFSVKNSYYYLIHLRAGIDLAFVISRIFDRYVCNGQFVYIIIILIFNTFLKIIFFKKPIFFNGKKSHNHIFPLLKNVIFKILNSSSIIVKPFNLNITTFKNIIYFLCNKIKNTVWLPILFTVHVNKTC